MKEFLKNNKITYNLMSFTGFRALILFTLLLESPKSYEEVCEYFSKHPYLQEKISVDTLRVYITSLKRVGCEIKRERIDGVSRYSILSHPFELSISEEQIQSIIKVYKNLIKNIEVNELVLMENFFNKINNYINNEEFISTFKKHSIFKDTDLKLTQELLDCCDKKEQIVILYNSPNSGKKEIEIIADKIEFSNNKLYLFGTGFEYMQYGSFLISRIVEIKEIKTIKTIPINIKEITVGYELSIDEPNLHLDKNEKILQKNNDKLIIEITSSNDFLIKQKLLSYGPDCKILYPESFKKDFVSKLEDMKVGYFNDQN